MPDALHKLSNILPNLFKTTRPVIESKSPIIISGNLLQLEEVHMFPLVGGLKPRIDPETNIKMYAALGGSSILHRILATDSKEYEKLVWTACDEMPVWIGSVTYEDSLEDLFSVLSKTKFGTVAVEGTASIRALVTLTDILNLYRDRKITSTLKASEVGSVMISASADLKLKEALKLMFQHKIRRIFLPKVEQYREKDYVPYVSDRNIIRFLFSPDRLEIVKKSPELWLEATLSEIEPSFAKLIGDGRTVNQISVNIEYSNVASCLVCRESHKIVSRWDLVMKPWMAKRYTVNASI